MYQSIRPLLFKLDPERIHGVTLRLIQLAGRLPPTYALLKRMFEVDDPRLETEAFGLKFKNPIGLAAGYDKNGVAVKGLSALGFGHVEVGTVTRYKQIGNPKPRVHRVLEAQGVINSMGFPNDGVETLAIRRGAAKVGINIGKSKDTPVEQAAEDYCTLFKRVYRDADYVAINISSPNTLNLRQLQARELIENLLKQVAAVRDSAARPSTSLRSAHAMPQPQAGWRARRNARVPLLVKIAPDLTESEIDDVLAAISLAGIDGIIATNTTIGRSGIPERYRDLKGGLSGSPLRDRSTAIIHYIARQTGGKLPIVGVGGIASARDAIDKLEAGATLLQVYTGLIYAGPSLVQQINRALIGRG
ncbi:MAG: quinone-dependent dihydroorotate dehydrogenase [Chloroflexi bacterium]|nr:quinone-dependent dihydroorotate dehydrogenase [Chloroflexota bacterium]